jgi:hypothetical protein
VVLASLRCRFGLVLCRRFGLVLCTVSGELMPFLAVYSGLECPTSR